MRYEGLINRIGRQYKVFFRIRQRLRDTLWQSIYAAFITSINWKNKKYSYIKKNFETSNPSAFLYTFYACYRASCRYRRTKTWSLINQIAQCDLCSTFCQKCMKQPSKHDIFTIYICVRVLVEWEIHTD